MKVYIWLERPYGYENFDVERRSGKRVVVVVLFW